MDIKVTPTSFLEVPKVWRALTISHGLSAVNGSLTDIYATSAYSQTLFFNGDADGKPVSANDGNGTDNNTVYFSSSKIEEALSETRIEDGRSVMEFIIELLEQLSKEA